MSETGLEIALEIEKQYTECGDSTYIDIICAYAEENGFDVEYIAKILPEQLKGKIESEALDSNLLTYKKQENSFDLL